MHDFAVLREGRSPRGTRWGVYVFNRLGRGNTNSKKRPCILLATVTKAGEYGYSDECGPLAPAAGVTVPPVTVGSGSARLFPGGNEVGESFWAMTFAPDIEMVEIDAPRIKTIQARTRLLSKSQAMKAHVNRFRYIAVSILEETCLDRVRGVDAVGAVRLDASFSEC